MRVLDHSESHLSRRRPRTFGALGAGLFLAVALVLAACGGTESSVGVNADGVKVSGGQPFVPSAETSATNGLPQVNVIDLSDGSMVNFATAAPSAKTTVLWFWAPH